MAKKILIVQGHPDASREHFGHALEAAYRQGAERAGEQVHVVEIATLKFDLLRRKEDWNASAVSEDMRAAQASVLWADHVVLIFPLWLGTMPALLKGFLENLLCEGFALDSAAPGKLPEKLLKGKSARIIVTMGMPALAYRIFYRAHSMKNLERNILGFCGFHPVRCSVFGNIEGSIEQRKKYLNVVELLGTAAA